MKHELFTLALQGSRRLALIAQFGNPAGTAPQLVGGPDEEDKFMVGGGGLDEVSIWKLKNVLCSGLYGGAVITESNQVYERFLAFPWGRAVHPSLTLPYIGGSAIQLKKAVMLLTPAPSGNYYHWLADVLPRLLLVLKARLADIEERVFILHNRCPSYETESFALLNIDPKRIIRIKPFQTVKVEDLIVPDFLVSADREPFPCWKQHLLSDFIDKMERDTKQNQGPKKVYLLRGNQRTRRLIGEEKLMAVMREQGFFILDAGQMSLHEQIRALRSARVVVAPHGAAMANILFCAEKTHVIELRSQHKPPEYFSEIAKAYHFKFTSVSLPPVKKIQAANLANEQDLVLIDNAVDELLRVLN
jgi:hypothetical protein